MIIDLLVFAFALLLILGLLGLMRNLSLYKRGGFRRARKNHERSPTEKLHDILFRQD